MKTVLVVDDNLVVRRQLRRLLERDGCLVYEAADGLEGLEVLRQKYVELVFLDLEMPRLNGLGFLQALKNQGLAVPVVLITGSECAKEILQAVKLGAKDYVVKPLGEPKIHRAIQLACGFDYTTVKRTGSHLVVLDAEDRLAQQVRGLAGSNDQVEHVKSMDGVSAVMVRPQNAVIVGSFSVPPTGDGQEAEAVGELVVSHNPDAVLIRMLDAPTQSLPEVTVFHGTVVRDDDTELAQTLAAVRSANCLTSGRSIRVMRFDGRAEHSPLYWCALRVSLERACHPLTQSSGSVSIDLSLAPDQPLRLEALSQWLSYLADTAKLKFVLKRDPPEPVRC